MLCHGFQPFDVRFTKSSYNSNQSLGTLEQPKLPRFEPSASSRLQPMALSKSKETPVASNKRSRLSRADYALLREFFNQNKYPEERHKKMLAAKISITKKQVSNWFVNARRPDRSAKKFTSQNSWVIHDT